MNSTRKNKFIYLLNNEVSKSVKIFISFLILFLLGHIGLFTRVIISINSNIKEYISTGKTLESYVVQNGKCSMSMILDNVGPQIFMVICFGILVIFLYAIIIWLREWFGNNKTVYTLMSLPVSRHSIILSKLICILIMGSTFIATHIIALFIDNFILNTFMASGVIQKEDVLKSFFHSPICEIFPNNLPMFIFMFSIIMCAVLIIFNCVMLERSFRWKGIVLGIINIIITVFLYVKVPSMANLFIKETVIYYSLLSIVLILLNYYATSYLLENKVHV